MIRSNVPATWDVETPGARSEENRRMLRAFRWNLRILSYISLLVGAFLVYNTIAVSVVRRRVEIGVLRAVGVSRRGILFMFLGEAAMLGVAGSVLGIGIGRVLAGALLGMISGTVNALFTTSAPGSISLSLWIVASALAAGTSVAIFSAMIPAIEAARVTPAEAMRRAIVEHQALVSTPAATSESRGVPRRARGVALPVRTHPRTSRLRLHRHARRSRGRHTARACLRHRHDPRPAWSILRRLGAPGLIAGRSLAASLSRTSIVVTALATAIAMMVAVGVMVGSFRETVQVWLETQLSADIYLRAQGPSTAGIYPPIAAPVADIIARAPDVDSIDILSALEIHYQGLRATFGGASMDILKRVRALRFLSGDGNAILASLPGRDRCIVTEPFAEKHHVLVGDVLQIPLGDRTAALTVAGIYYDYSSDRGFVLVDRGTLLKYLPAQPITNIAVYLKPGGVKPGADAARVRRDLETRLAAYPLMIAPNEELRRGAVEVFDRTFAVTWALEGVAILVAMLGAANSLLALVLDRRREIGLIRYLGAATGQVRQMILTEAGLVGLLAGLLGLALGMVLSLILIYVINKQSFGWTIQFHPPAALLAGALLLVWAVTVLAGVYPARFAARLEPAEVVHEE